MDVCMAVERVSGVSSAAWCGSRRARGSPYCRLSGLDSRALVRPEPLSAMPVMFFVFLISDHYRHFVSVFDNIV